MKTRENNSSVFAWILILAIVLYAKISAAKVENYQIGVNFNSTSNWLNEEVKEELWLSYLKMAEGSWINFSFRDTSKLSQTALINKSKTLSDDLLGYFKGKGLLNKNVKIQYTPTASLVVHKEKGGGINANFISLNKDDLQVFQINNLTGGACLTNAGNKIVFPALAFKCPNTAIVQVEIYEMVSRKDFINTGYTSTSSGRNLVSNGMYEIDAQYNDENVGLKSGVSAEIHFAKGNFEQQHETNTFHSFYGDRKKDIIDWKPSYHEKASGNGVQTGFLSNAKKKPNNGKSGNGSFKRTVTYTETMYVQLCRKIHLIDQQIYNSMNNCLLPENTYNQLVKKYGSLNIVKKGKFEAIENYNNYLAKNNKTPNAILIGLNEDQAKRFKQNEQDEKDEIAVRNSFDDEEYDDYAALSEEDQQKAIDQQKEQFPVVMKISQLGSINCDRFDNNQNKTDVIVRLNDYNYDKIKVYAVFKDIKSVIHGYYRPEHKGAVKFDALPEGESVIYLAATFKGDEIKLAYLSKDIKKDDVVALALKSYSKEQYNRILDDLIPN